MDRTHIPLEGRLIPLTIRRHRRARRIGLRLSPARDGIVLTLPSRASVASGMDFFHSKRGWVLANVEPDSTIPFADGVQLPLLGETYTVRRMDGRGVTALKGKELLVYGAREFVARRVRDFLVRYLREECFSRAQAMALTLGKSVRSVKVRHTRSRWGSCSHNGVLTFHWQLVFAPLTILTYLIAHETAHLVHMNHSSRFWDTVAQIHPPYADDLAWLRREGHLLYRYGA